ncbi:hypothetical protein Ocin01_06975 [Orchesella cincta]|uniref:KASH domain-containing protein n=1 Tax=Orchesella cincta TaxID=48709 RepID=A0A1D2N451_ORCCI|nr:hypothetical protein Ocin01_06975 [Orchesella cincta]
MRYLQDAWEQFEKEKLDFEKSVTVSSMRKLRKELSSSASTDSGHGTDFSHDSSISDSDMDFQERHKKLVALKERAKKVKAFLPPGSPVLDILDQSVEEAEKGLTSLSRPTTSTGEIIDLKSLYPRKKPFIYRRTSGQKSPKSKLLTPVPKRMNRRWTVVRRMVFFNVALMGIFLAAAYFLHPKCCEFTNTFCFSLVPQLTHESLPPI